MKKQNRLIKAATGKEGIALLIILGVLSLLLVMALSLSGSMRADLSIARVHSDAIRVRHMVPMAVDRAMVELAIDTATTPSYAIAHRRDWTVPPAQVMHTLSGDISNGEYPIYVTPAERFVELTYGNNGAGPLVGFNPTQSEMNLRNSKGVRAHFSAAVQNRLNAPSFQWLQLKLGDEKPSSVTDTGGGGGGGRGPKPGGGGGGATPGADKIWAGAFAFFAENVSGFIDINAGIIDPDLVDASVPQRQYGAQPFEIPFQLGSDNLSLNTDLAELKELLGDWDVGFEDEQYVRFEGLAEMRAAMRLTSGEYLNNVTHFSYSPQGSFHPPTGEVYTNANLTVQNADTADSLVSDAALRALLAERFKFLGENGTRFGDPGNFTIDTTEAMRLVDKYKDYLDVDLIPYDSPACTAQSCESVPMINEFILNEQMTIASVSGASPTYSYTFGNAKFKIETWYPFVTPPLDPSGGDAAFKVVGNVEYTVRYDDGSGLQDGFVETVAMNFTDQTYTTPVRGSDALYYTFEGDETFVGTLPIAPGALVALEIEAKLRDVQMVMGTDVVDAVGDEIKRTWRLSGAGAIGAPIPLGTQADDGSNSYEIADPRDNHMGWVAKDTPTENLLNDTAAAALNTAAGGTSTSSDMDTLMYCRNNREGITIQTPGELGYLPVTLRDGNSAWQTLRLVAKRGDGKYHRVFDYFTTAEYLDSNDQPLFQRALINPNAASVTVLAYAFLDMPVELYPGQETHDPNWPASGTGRLNWDDAVKIAEAIVAARRPGGNFQPFLTPSDMVSSGDLREAMRSGLSIGPVTSELAIESVVRNAMGLFSTRNNVLNMAVFVKGPTAGYERVMATIWRDAYPEFYSGIYPTGVHSVQPIND